MNYAVEMAMADGTIDQVEFESRDQVLETLSKKRDLTGADLSGLDLSGMKFLGVKMTGANLRDADLTGSIPAGADISGANLSNTQLTRSKSLGSTWRTRSCTGPSWQGPGSWGSI